jgi:hypothetical protein
MQQTNDFFQAPNVVCNPRFHCGRHAQRLVNPAEIVVHIMNRDGVFMILNLL